MPSTTTTTTLDAWWPHITAAVGAVVCVVFGSADLWHFHALAANTDLGLFYLGVGALGVTGAYVAGKST